ncbi:hypothetical protein YC2023_018336 [Brassica napus]
MRSSIDTVNSLKASITWKGENLRISTPSSITETHVAQQNRPWSSQRPHWHKLPPLQEKQEMENDNPQTSYDEQSKQDHPGPQMKNHRPLEQTSDLSAFTWNEVTPPQRSLTSDAVCDSRQQNCPANQDSKRSEISDPRANPHPPNPELKSEAAH